MLIRALFLVFCLYSLPCLAVLLDCDVFLSSKILSASNIAHLDPLPRQKESFEDWELARAGEVFHIREHSVYPLEREGNYPVLVFSDGHLGISHRLPDVTVDPIHQPFLATHMSLYRKMEDRLKHSPANVVFAGHLRVIGGRPVRLVDQSGHFHEKPSLRFEFGGGGSDTRQDLQNRNQLRLELARAMLSQILGVSSDLEILNLRERSQGRRDDVLADGHLSDRRIALYELSCRQNKKCWQDYQIFESLMPILQLRASKKGWMKFYTEPFGQSFGDHGFDYLMILNQAAKVGVLDLMAGESFRHQQIDDFVLSVPRILEILTDDSKTN